MIFIVVRRVGLSPFLTSNSWAHMTSSSLLTLTFKLITNFTPPKNNNLLPHHAISDPIGEPFIELSQTDSSNNYAMGQIHAGMAKHGTTYFAHSQTAGKGQRGKKWITNKNENIILSAVLEPPQMLASQPFLLSALVALACYDFFKNYAQDKTSIKWPNDLYWGDRKAGGILIENVFKGTNWSYAVVGIGININQTVFSENIPNPVSLRQITGKDYNVISVAKELCNCIEDRYQSLFLEQPKDSLEKYNSVLYKLHQPVRLKKQNIVFETTIEGVSAAGRLLTRDTIARQFEFGEIEWLK
jgi:BirA family biotin operon repressor/biotin-[acetyl-CoA-carboxylase] ligase